MRACHKRPTTYRSPTTAIRSESRRSRRRVVVVTGSAAFLLALGITFTRWNASLPQASNYVQITNDGHQIGITPKPTALCRCNRVRGVPFGSLYHFHVLECEPATSVQLRTDHQRRPSDRNHAEADGALSL